IKKTEIPLMGKLPEEGGEYFGKKSIGFEHGLMIKKRTKQFASPEEINKQLSNKQFFKPKDNTVLEAIKSKTKVLEKKEALAQKKAALERLKLSAKQINKGKTNIKRAEEMEEIEEELLGDIGNEEP
ncbi:MAG: hypothetical protein NTY48_00080, partial [Candidatus Diapherotrites archaeon]|nr:hypothetical protein [Candidatus Diapherotrites archaeon]